MERRKNSHLEQAFSSVPKVKTQTDVNSLNDIKVSPVTKAETPCLCVQGEKSRHVVIDIIPCVVVASLETDAFMVIVAHFEMVTIRPSKKS